MEWIKIENELPENTKSRPVICADGYEIASYIKDGNESNNYKPYWVSIAGYHIFEVSLWQQLPNEYE